MKIYTIKNPKEGRQWQVKVLFETEHLILHRPCREPLDSKVRTYVITIKNVSMSSADKNNKLWQALNNPDLVDLCLRWYCFTSIPKLKIFMSELEKEFDFSRTYQEMSRDDRLKHRIKYYA